VPWRRRRRRRRHRRAQVRDRLLGQVRRLQGLTQALADAVAAKGPPPSPSFAAELDDLKVTLKENIELGTVVRFEAADGNVLDTYCTSRTAAASTACSSSSPAATAELAHDIAVHIAFTKPTVPDPRRGPGRARSTKERATLEDITRRGQARAGAAQDRRGSPQRLVQGAGAARAEVRADEKQTIAQLLGDATLVRFAQVVIAGG
jgi:elongation factor Ts